MPLVFSARCFVIRLLLLPRLLSPDYYVCYHAYFPLRARIRYRAAFERLDIAIQLLQSYVLIDIFDAAFSSGAFADAMLVCRFDFRCRRFRYMLRFAAIAARY